MPANSIPHHDEIVWLSTQEAAHRLGITPRTLYRFIDEGQLPAYRFGRVIRLKLAEVDAFIDRSRIQPGTLEHLYPEPAHADAVSATAEID
jgi:excisionase family DNA binding protein